MDVATDANRKLAEQCFQKSTRFSNTTHCTCYVSSTHQDVFVAVCVVGFDPIFVQRCLSQGDRIMKNKNLITLASLATLMALVSFSGCASTCNTCNSGGLTGARPWLQNQPVRSTIRSWFQGDNCSTCNTPSGQVQSPNIAPLCDTCNTGGISGGTAPLYGGPTGNVQLGAPGIAPAGQQPGPVTIGNGVNPPQM